MGEPGERGVWKFGCCGARNRGRIQRGNLLVVEDISRGVWDGEGGALGPLGEADGGYLDARGVCTSTGHGRDVVA